VDALLRLLSLVVGCGALTSVSLLAIGWRTRGSSYCV